ncbi:MAG: putative DNA modification/repair radical SAM protein [Evtepia sp.]|uniref:putative DNA modification/repair radical SAM protein n=1 Tax=Evtepia sp. TaxID=2773933 RepID=UPI002A74874F|nr:putative DNA modification/repair radical SAM protein [Evtepia sp.]MDY3014513.1 putative DNA modification/repair radical SAM protein [Evtepia sp.]
MTTEEKLTILTDAAKYDAACTSSGARRGGGQLGKTMPAGCCHSFSADGRCISLLKVLLTNICCYDCQYCVNRSSNDIPRAMFTPRELADLTLAFYRRNYIEGLFLSSAVAKSPDDTTERMIKTLSLLRNDYGFTGYIHAKAIPGADPALTAQLGRLADRLSVNIELPSSQSLALLAPDKKKEDIFRPMAQIREGILEAEEDRKKFRSAPTFSPAGQSTQMIIGATEETDYQILKLSEGMYQKYNLKRVFFSAYIPVTENPLLPSPQTFQPPLLREHRLYQSDWLLRFYHFQADEILSPDAPALNPLLDPKCNWAMNHLDCFPIEVNTADYRTLLRVPGIGPVSARRIVTARKWRALDHEALKKLGVVLKRAQYFITCSGKMTPALRVKPASILQALTALEAPALAPHYQQLSLFPS